MSSYQLILFSSLLFLHNVTFPSVLSLNEDGLPLVHTKVGSIRGLRAEDGHYSMFMGIPYAEVNKDNPFGDATPRPIFENIFDAFDDSAICPQIEEFNNTIVGTLDCLHLNIYIPDSASVENPLPVFVWIYGGYFSIGFAGRYLYGPSFIVRYDVILVTLNYRLGPYGFMCLDTPEVPGNQGLKDQRIALRWIKNNIAAFGGDVSRITLAGNSAGGLFAKLHLDYGGEELFRRIIVESGVSTVLNVVEESSPTSAAILAEQFNYTSSSLNDAVSFLAKIDAHDIISRANKAGLTYGLCVEKKFDNVENFITVHPVNVINKKLREFDILIGYNNDEKYCDYFGWDKEKLLNENIVYQLLNCFDFGQEYVRVKELQHIISQFYFGDAGITKESRSTFIDAASDIGINHPTMRTVKKYLEHGVESLYLYLFSYSGGRNYVKHRRNITGGGACHADEIGYLFDISYMKKPLDFDDKLIIDRMTKLWTNFIKHGNPTPAASELVPMQWPRVTRDKCYYLDIDTELRVSTRPMRSRVAFLDLLFEMNEKYRTGLHRVHSGARNVMLDISLPLLFAAKYIIYT